MSLSFALDLPSELRVKMLERSLDWRRLRTIEATGVACSAALTLALALGGSGVYALLIPSFVVPAAFAIHSIAISKDRRLFVVDRGHRRIQVFDENGKFLDMWSTGVRSLPFHHVISAADQSIWIIDGGTQRVVKYDLNGKYLYGWGGPGGQPGQFNGGHQITVDQEGNLYIAEVFGGRVQKFRPKPNADRAKIVGPELRYPVAGSR